MSLTILNVAHRKSEPNSFVYIREKGFGPEAYLFVHFLLPAVVVIDGVEHLTNANACILYPPEQKQEYRHYNGLFLNDFIIFKTDDTNFAARFGLPENEIFYVSNGDKISNLVSDIAYTITDKTIDRSEQTPYFIIKLFETLSTIRIENNPKLKRAHEIKKRFIAMRDEVRSNPKGWTVDKMAKRVWLTRSRFAVLYMEFFKVSPRADLINIKITHAKTLLESTDMPVTEVSEVCGYTNVGHFIRIFNKHVKCTPLQYRKNFTANA
ncbi:MAG: AraC family transcriptional regulator [Firmicutes bacterium]|nr:AraC family transcriptional regulator [Bacillota bacterium]